MRKLFKTTLLICTLLSLVASAPAAQPESHSQQEKHLGLRLAHWLENHGVPRSLAVVSISTLPIVELRGAIPVGHILWNVNDPQKTLPEKGKLSLWIYFLALCGNMIPIPFILLLLGPVSKFCMRFRLGRSFFEWLFARTRRKSASIEKYEELGLTLFVAIPLPVTGGWTGSAAAFLMGTKFRRAMLCILLGVMISGIIMTLLSLLGWIGATIAGLVLSWLACVSIWKSLQTKPQKEQSNER